TDAEDDFLYYFAIVNFGRISANVIGTDLQILPAPDWNGVASITVIVDDAIAGFDMETFEVAVTPVNDLPTLAAIGNQTTQEDTNIILPLVINDVDQDNLQVTATVNSGNVSALISGNQLILSPETNLNGTASITVTVDDGNGGIATETFDLTVTSVNDEPVLADVENQTIPEDSTITITLAAYDEEDDPLTWDVTVNSGDVTATLDGLDLLLVPAQDWYGTANITVTIDDGNGGTAEDTFDLIVTPINDVPVLAEIGQQVIEEDSFATITLSATDAEDDVLFYFGVVNYGGVSANVIGNQLSIIPAPDWNGPANITVLVDDGIAGFDMETFDVIVTPVNDAPVLAPVGDQSIDEDTNLSLQLLATDVDLGDVLTFTATVNSGNVQAAISDSTLEVVPAQDWAGIAEITIKVSDGNGGFAEETINVTVNQINDVPVLTNIGPQATDEEVMKIVTLSATDVEGDELTYSAVLNSGNATVVLNGTQLEITPDLEWSGIVNITVTVTDGNGGSAQETFDTTVTAVNDAPILSLIGPQFTPEDVTKVIELIATDIEGDLLTFSMSVDSDNVEALLAGSTLYVIPDDEWSGSVTITVTVEDGNGGSDEETFDLVVIPVNDAPVIA
ncbi:MAG: tandem-95 repeat protein, partial [Euryarchaeota archaeon]|nr:tandem-95 repeat protein [Euryarchaeota archaeon]